MVGSVKKAAFIGAGVEIPKACINASSICRALTVNYRRMGDPTPIPVAAYVDTGPTIVLPREYGLHLISNLDIEVIDRCSYGYLMDFPVEVTHTGKYAYQKDFVAEILENTRTRYDFMVHAATGKGKSVCALSVIQKLGVTAIVLVDQENLLLQWVAECKKVLHLTDDQIGVVQGPVCSYEDKHVTIAMVQTLKTREFAEEFYRNFGVVVFDEVHSVGAPTFSKTLLMFPASIRFGVSATVDRKDSLQKLLQWNLGEVAVSLLDKHESSLVYFVRNHTVYSWYANISPKSGRILKEISEDGKRNNLLCRIVQWLYEEGDRDILVIGDRIEQLENLMAMCAYAGVPEDDMGLYCGFRNIWAFAKDPTPKRRPAGYERGTEYTPVTFGRVRKRIPRAELESIKNCKRIIFATYGMFSKGVDVPRLSAGVDCTPRSKTEQVHGRILRVLDGKYLPLWVTIRDVFSYKTEHQFHQRIQGYVASSAEIYEWELNKGVRSWDVSALSREVSVNIRELKAQNIETLEDGRYMLTAPSTRTRYAGKR